MLVSTSQSAMLEHLHFTLRQRLGVLHEEAASGRRAGPQALSAQAHAAPLHVERAEIQQRVEARRNISARLSATDVVMTEVHDAFSSLSGGLHGPSGKSDALASAHAASSRMRDALATQFQGVDLVTEGRNATSAVAMIEAKFGSRFGFASDDPRATALSADEFAAFAKATVAEIAAADSPARASSRAFDRPSVHEAAFSEILAWADVMTVLAASGISEKEFDRLNVRLSGDLDISMRKLSDKQAEVGRAQGSARQVAEFQSQRLTILDQQIGELEGADPYAVAAAVNQLSGQLEATYRMMGKLQPLALARFL